MSVEYKIYYRILFLLPAVGVVVFFPRPMEGMGRLQLSDLFTELPVPPQATGVIRTFYYFYYYISF